MKRFVLLILLFLYPLPSTLYPAFKDTGWGVRPVSMGGAFIAISDDASAILYNPAGISRMKHPELNFMYSKLYMGLDAVDLGLNYAAVVYPTKNIGCFGFNWANFTSVKQYREDTVTLTYAESINKICKRLFRCRLFIELSAGINLKYLQHSYTLDKRTVNDPVFASGDSKSNITVDAGLLSRPFPKYLPNFSIGMGIKNISQPDVGLKTIDIVPAEMGLGVAYKINRFYFMRNILSAVDITYRNQNWGKPDDRVTLRAGVEAHFASEILVLRLGYNSTELSSGFGIKTPRKYKFDLQLDYALLWPLQIKQTTGSHRLSLTYRFGKSDSTGIVEMPGRKIGKKVEHEKKEIDEKRKKQIMRQHYNKAIQYFKSGNDDKAIKEFETVLIYNSQHRPSLMRLEVSKKRLEEMNKKKKIKYHWGRGIKFFQQEKFEEARGEFNEILKIEPTHYPSKKRLELIEKK